MTDTKTAHPSDAMVEAYFPEIDPLMLQIVRDFWDDGNQTGHAAGVEESANLAEDAYADARDDSAALCELADDIRDLLPDSTGDK